MIRNIAVIGILNFILSGCYAEMFNALSHYSDPYPYPRYHTDTYTAQDQAQDWTRIYAEQDAQRERRNIQRRLGDIEQRERYRSLY